MFSKLLCFFLLASLNPQASFSKAFHSTKSIQQTSQEDHVRIFQLSEKTDNAWVKFDGYFLYWKPYSDGMDYEYPLVDINNAVNLQFYQDEQEVKSVKLSWDPGYRFQAAVFLPEIYFDTSVAWTHFSSFGSNQIFDEIYIESGSRGVQARRIDRIWLLEESLLSANTTVENIKGDLKLKLSYLDWELGKLFSLPE